MEFLVEGATKKQEMVWSIGGGPSTNPDKNGLVWDYVSANSFNSEAGAWAWVEENHQTLAQHSILAVRVLRVVGYRTPQVITLFHETTYEQVVASLPKRARGSGLQWGDVPGDEWKRDDD